MATALSVEKVGLLSCESVSLYANCFRSRRIRAGLFSKLPFTDMAHMELNIDFNLEKSRALIWVFECDFKCEICAKSEHCSGFQAQCSDLSRSSAPGCGYLKFAFSAHKHIRN